MAATRGTMAEVAAAAGVSVPTVSKVLNGRADVSEATRQRVFEAVSSTGYAGRKPPSRDLTGVIDLLIEGVDSPWALEIIRGAESAAAHRGSAVVVTSSVHETFELRRWLDAVTARRSDGVIAVLPSLGGDSTAALAELRVPVVLIDPDGRADPNFATIGATNWAGGFEATNRLIELGHRRIGLIAGPTRLPAALQRLEGYAAALRRAGIAYDPELVVEAEFRITGGHEAAGKLLDLKRRPTAIFSSSDQQAAGLYEAARERDIRIPSELSVIGFDDTVLSRYLSPALTTVHQPLGEMAAEAIRLVQELAVNPGAQLGRRFELATRLVERRSAVAPAGR
ncbi:LacI family DNA-binding transcriptional regulator [Gryllotalpicola ginsengisoli]|uniref:LacI family DNA-binding transcriptional regulator n=1 Tax=Gryllotalpicola ginsengisoli TaxID=444608 RepID=UPI00040FC6F4|nr:LacI family DNA-binding transcriptional regulator [Gryllotalpicola ginsengisoli]